MSATKTINVRNAFTSERGTYRAIVDEDGTVRVWDATAGHFTACHSLTARQVASARRRWAKADAA